MRDYEAAQIRQMRQGWAAEVVLENSQAVNDNKCRLSSVRLAGNKLPKVHSHLQTRAVCTADAWASAQSFMVLNTSSCPRPDWAQGAHGTQTAYKRHSRCASHAGILALHCIKSITLEHSVALRCL